jgi:hypothetical protein
MTDLKQHAVKAQAEIDQAIPALFAASLEHGPRLQLLLSRNNPHELAFADDETLALIMRFARLGHAVMCVSVMEREPA